MQADEQTITAPIPPHVQDAVVAELRTTLQATREAAVDEPDPDFSQPIIADEEECLRRAVDEYRLDASAETLAEIVAGHARSSEPDWQLVECLAGVLASRA